MPGFPAGAEYLWRCYLRLRRRAAPGFDRAAPVGWQDIDAFIRRAGIRLTSWEIEIIEAIDDAFLDPGAAVPATPDGKVKEVASTQDGAAVKALMGAVGERRVVRRRKRDKHG